MVSGLVAAVLGARVAVATWRRNEWRRTLPTSSTTFAEVVEELRSQAEAWRRMAESSSNREHALPRLRQIEDEILRVLAEDARRGSAPSLDYTYRVTAGAQPVHIRTRIPRTGDRCDIRTAAAG